MKIATGPATISQLLYHLPVEFHSVYNLAFSLAMESVAGLAARDASHTVPTLSHCPVRGCLLLLIATHVAYQGAQGLETRQNQEQHSGALSRLNSPRPVGTLEGWVSLQGSGRETSSLGFPLWNKPLMCHFSCIE